MPDALPYGCFGEYGFQGVAADQGSTQGYCTSAGGRTKAAAPLHESQNSVTCIYQTKLLGRCRPISVTWCKSLLGHGLCVGVQDDPSPHSKCRVDMNPWFFWKLQGSKSLNVNGKKVEVLWDMASAKYSHGPEPQEGFYLAIVSEAELVLLLGDMTKEAYKKTQTKVLSVDPILLSRREHICGKKYYTTKAQLGEKGKIHEIMIECHTDGTREPRLCVMIDRQLMVQVKRLAWKFRGNQTIRVDGIVVEVFWDVYNWIFNPGLHGNAVFMFQTCLPSASATDRKLWLRDATDCSSLVHRKSAPSCTEAALRAAGFSLSLYAWKSE